MGITSFGDSVSLLEDSLNIFESFECTYAVLACRSEVSSTYKYIQEQLNNVEPLILKTPTSDSQKLAQNKDDGRVAEEIHKKIFRMYDGYISWKNHAVMNAGKDGKAELILDEAYAK